MARTIDPNIAPSFYLANNAVHEDFDTTWLGRKILNWTGLRDYNLANIFKACSDSSTRIPDENIKNHIFIALAKKYDLEGIATKILSIEGSRESVVQSLLIEIAKDSGLAEKLIKFQRAIPKTASSGEIIHEVVKRHASLKKWEAVAPYVEEIGGKFNRIAHSRQIHLLAEKRILFNLAAFQNSTKEGREKHKLIVNEGKLKFRSEGKWTDVDFLQTLKWDTEEKRCFALNGKGEKQRWNYLSQPGNEGFIPFDDIYDTEEPPIPDHNKELKPSEKISREELQALQLHASKFEYPNPLEELGDCVFQIVSHPPRPYLNPMMDNFNKEFPNHVYMRIIDSNGNVYSTGTIGSRETLKKLKSPLNFFNSGTVHAGVFDTDESRKHSGRLTTSIPISKEKADKLVEYLKDHRANGRRFNVIRQNCVKLVLLSMKKIEVLDDIDQMTSTVAGKLINAFPTYESFGIVGSTFNYVSESGRVITKTVHNQTPACVIYAFKCLRRVFMWMPKMVMYSLTNMLVLTLGGTKQATDSPNLGGDEAMKPFDQLITGIKDLTKKETQLIYDSTKITEWMLQQKSTVATHYDKPSLNLFPDESDSELLNVYKERYHILSGN